jgi:hypothetical protein
VIVVERSLSIICKRSKSTTSEYVLTRGAANAGAGGSTTGTTELGAMPDDGLALPLPPGEQEHRLPSLPGEPLLAVTMAAGSTTVDASNVDLRGL